MLLTIMAAFAAATTGTPPVPVVTTASANVGTRPLPGLNVSGCEFADNAALCPTPATIDAYASMGFKMVRIPVKSSQLGAAIPKLQPTVAEALNRGIVTIIDLHDYLPLDAARIVPLIQKVATAFGPDVWIDYDNEPKAPTGATESWVSSATATNAIIAGARSAGVTNTLVAEWPTYSGNYRLASAELSTQPCGSFACGLDRVGGLQDPLGKTVLGPHRYYDSDKSGTHNSCATTSFYWSVYIQAAELRNLKSVIGETAFGNAATGAPSSCTAAGAQIMSEILGSKSIIGYNVWGGGAAWKAGYLFAVPPTASATAPYVKQILGQ